MSRSGFISILGKPNVGKSTLLNRLVGTKLAGVSKRPQTTRQIIRGILTRPEGQLVFLDTPGLHEPRDGIGRFMMSEAQKTFVDADLFFFIVESRVPNESDHELLQKLFHNKNSDRRNDGRQKSIFCLINKIDAVSKLHILPVMDAYQKSGLFDEIIPISALKGTQLDVLLKKAFEYLPEQAPYFSDDISSDQAERFLVGELIREKIFRLTGEEIPYSSAVEVEEFKEEDRLIRIHAVIFVEKDSQKAIIIGAQGQKIKEMGIQARRDLEKLLGKKVFLKLWVKTLKNWKQSAAQLKRLGLG
jgi:GTPase